MTPCRQIRAQWDKETVTVYQAFNAIIADVAVAEQRLSASPEFKKARFTYRCGYSFKDKRQERVLALRVKHSDFQKILAAAILAHEQTDQSVVKVQWDPERGPRLEKFDYRSIQIGLSGEFSRRWADEWIDSIEDVTRKARELKKAIDENPQVTDDELRGRGLLPQEEVYDEMVPEDIKRQLGMLADP